MSDRYCLNCGSRVAEGLKYCPVCGNPMSAGNQNNRSQNKIKPHGMAVPDINLESEPLPSIDKQGQTQQLDLNSIRLSSPASSTLHSSQEKAAPISAPQKKHGKLYNAFIEDDDEEDDYSYDDDDEETAHSHAKVIILIIIAVILAGCIAFFFTHRSLFTSDKSDTEQTAETAEPTFVPTDEPAVTEEPAAEETVNDGTIGSLVVNSESINERSTPSTDGDAVGQVSQGETYDVYETQESGGLTWYRIGEDQWIADGGGWVTYTPDAQ